MRGSPSLQCSSRGRPGGLGTFSAAVLSHARNRERVIARGREVELIRSMHMRTGCRDRCFSIGAREAVRAAATPDSQRTGGDTTERPDQWRWEDVGAKLFAVAAAVVLPFAPFPLPHNGPCSTWELTGASSAFPDQPGHHFFTLSPAALANGLLQMPPLKLNNE